MTTLDPKSRAASRGMSDIAIRNLFIIPTIAVPDRLQHLSADLFARLLVHRLPRLVQRAGQFRRPAELSDAAQRPVHLAHISPSPRNTSSSRWRARSSSASALALLLNRDIPFKGLITTLLLLPMMLSHGGRRPVLEAALRSVLRHHQLCARARQFRMAVERRHGALRGRHHRHLDVVALRDAAVARRPVGGAEAPLRGRRDRPRRRALHLLPHHAAAGRADPDDRDHLPHHGGVQDLRPRLHPDQPADRPR